MRKSQITSEETKRKIGEANRGKKHTPEQVLANSLSHKGQIAWNRGLTKETDERVRKNSRSSPARKWTSETRSKNTDFWSTERGKEIRKDRSERMAGSNNAFFKIRDISAWKEKVRHPGQENAWYGKISPGIEKAIKSAKEHPHMLGKHHPNETKAKIGNSNRGKIRSQAIRKVISDSHKKWWAALSIEDKHRQIRSMMLALGSKRPTSLEKIVGEVLDKICPNEYEYVGNGKLLIEGKSPDFINSNGKKKLIEVFGNYWHSKNRTGRVKEDEEKYRVSLFSKYGFETLVIWENETKDKEELTNKILSFVRSK